MSELTQSRLQELLHYDPESGVFTWLTRPANCIHIGDIAGYTDKTGCSISCDGKRYTARRLACLYVTGHWPTQQIGGGILTQQRLKELLAYDPNTGIFIWLSRSTQGFNRKMGAEAGCLRDGYISIKIDCKTYQAHRLAFLYVNGQFPKHHIDHKDAIRNNNVWSNLREATHQQNQQNLRTPYRNNTSGFMGVCWHKGTKKWSAAIRLNGKDVWLGVYPSPAEASAVYLEAKRRLHPYCTI